MRFWLIQIGEPVPTPGNAEDSDRPFRVRLLADELVGRGHEVTWWTTTFDHFYKRHLHTTDTIVNVRPNLRLRFIHTGIAYSRNLSLARIANHVHLASRFRALAAREQTPDLILCGLPTPELSLAAVRYGRIHGVPVLLDLRDMWPDDMIEALPATLRPLGRICLLPMRRAVRKACAGATALCGVSRPFVNWGLRQADRKAGPDDRDFPLAYSLRSPEDKVVRAAEQFWRERGVERSPDQLLVCFFGALGATCRLEAVIRAAKRLETAGRKVTFIIGGKGDKSEYLRQLGAQCSTVRFVGWVGRAEIWTMLRWADVGLVPISSIFSYRSNLPNKAIEYMSAGLPIVSCLQGMTADVIREHQIGCLYDTEDDLQLSQILADLSDNRAQLRAMSANAHRLFENRFVAEKVIAAFASHLESMAAPNRFQSVERFSAA